MTIKNEFDKTPDSVLEKALAQPACRCPNCDGTGDVHSPDGQWRGECHCKAQQEQPAQEPDPVLCKFYQVTTFEELISAQEHHINKLQAKLKKENDNGMGSILVRKSRAASDQWSGCVVVGCAASESQTGQVAKAQQEQPEAAKQGGAS